MARQYITNAQWEKLRPLFPQRQTKRGRPRRDDRQVLEGILWVLRTGAPWRDLPEKDFGPWQSYATRFYRWVHAGVWQTILAQLQYQSDGEGTLDWTLHHIDGSIVRAHQHAAGAQKKGMPTTLKEQLEIVPALLRSKNGKPEKLWAAVKVVFPRRSISEWRDMGNL